MRPYYKAILLFLALFSFDYGQFLYDCSDTCINEDALEYQAPVRRCKTTLDFSSLTLVPGIPFMVLCSLFPADTVRPVCTHYKKFAALRGPPSPKV